jgi:hypothetical protein
MAYFHCLIGGGSSGGGYELTVTCDAAFAGTTITATDGVTTLTQTCPSASPYEVVFEIPNGGDWTISGVVGGHTVSTGVNIPTSAELIATVQQTVTIYSAKEDTISYTDIDGATQTITFASGETSKQVTITIEPSGSSITFTSSVAKNPNNLSQDYSKTFTITTSTTDIYLMPDAVKTLYWWGYVSDNLQNCTSANGWSVQTYSMVAPTYNTSNISMATSSSQLKGVGTTSKVNLSSVKAIATGVTISSSVYAVEAIATAKDINNLISYNYLDSNSITLVTLDASTSGEYNVTFYVTAGRNSTLHALWYE